MTGYTPQRVFCLFRAALVKRVPMYCSFNFIPSRSTLRPHHCPLELMADRVRGRLVEPAKGRSEPVIGRGRDRPKRARPEQTMTRPVLRARTEPVRDDAEILTGQLGAMTSETPAVIAQMVQSELRVRGVEAARLEEVVRAEREAQGTLEAQTAEHIARELEAETLAASRRATEAERV